jgi:serine/threonine protein kinase
MAVSIGDVLDGKYRVVRVVGEGGMGTVYEGEYARIRRRVAIKVLRPSANAEEIVTRFEREAQAAGRIGNEHILEVFDLGTLPSGAPYMVTEFLDGTTLAQRIEKQGPLSTEAVSLIAQQVLVALDAAHGAGIVHRDLKPDNIFIVHQKGGLKDFVKLIDFGISKFENSAEPGSLKVTRLGSLLGTPTYMSPEIARGTAEADARTDIYGLGVIMYEAITRRLPFDGTNLNDLLFKIVEGQAPELHTLVADLDPEFAAMIMRAMAKNPAERFASANEFLSVLTDWMAMRGIGPIRASAPSFPSAEGLSELMQREGSGASRRISAASRTPMENRARSVTPNPTTVTPNPTTERLPATPTMQSKGVTGATGDSIARGWSGTQSIKVSDGARIAVASAFLVLVLGGIGGFLFLRAGKPAPTPTAASSSQGATPPTREAPPVADTTPPVASTAREDAHGAGAAPSVTAGSATAPSATPKTAIPFLPKTAGVASTPPSARTAASSSSGAKPPKGADDEIPGMR